MKTAIYIEDGTLQLVLTPETEFEKSSLRTLVRQKLSTKIFEGTFYACQGGWIRQSPSWGVDIADRSTNDASLILRVDNIIQEPAT